jgi:hypothetical protein
MSAFFRNNWLFQYSSVIPRKAAHFEKTRLSGKWSFALVDRFWSIFFDVWDHIEVNGVTEVEWLQATALSFLSRISFLTLTQVRLRLKCASCAIGSSFPLIIWSKRIGVILMGLKPFECPDGTREKSRPARQACLTPKLWDNWTINELDTKQWIITDQIRSDHVKSYSMRQFRLFVTRDTKFSAFSQSFNLIQSHQVIYGCLTLWMPSIFFRIPRFPEFSELRCGFPFSRLCFLFVNLFFNWFAIKRSGFCNHLFTHCHKKSKLIDLKGQLFESGFAQTKVFIISMRISYLSVEPLKFSILSNSSHIGRSIWEITSIPLLSSPLLSSPLNSLSRKNFIR